jgi:ribosomal protein S21
VDPGLIDKRREVGTTIRLGAEDELELALKLFRADGLMAKGEARRKRQFIGPSARRKLKAATARRRAARAKGRHSTRAT